MGEERGSGTIEASRVEHEGVAHGSNCGLASSCFQSLATPECKCHIPKSRTATLKIATNRSPKFVLISSAIAPKEAVSMKMLDGI
jgi:hypothetical protein